MYTQHEKKSAMYNTIVVSVIGLCLLATGSDCSTSSPIRHVIVLNEKGRFCGWPANNGVWGWGNEILVGFHQADRTKPLYPDCARPGREGARGILNAFGLIQLGPLE